MHLVSSRKKYDTFVVWLYGNNKEHLLPEEFRKTIPSSTASTWRAVDFTSYTGYEFRSIQNESMEWYEMFHRHQKLKMIVKVLARVWISLSTVIIPFLSKSQEYSERIINEIQRLFTVLPKQMVLKLAGISAPAFHYRLNKIKTTCAGSPVFLCLKRHPLQLSFREITTMKDLLNDTRFICWPVPSLAHYARRNGMLYASLSVWYKYVQILALKRKFQKPEKSVGLKSSRPNQFLHVDTTFWKLADGSKRAITFVSDNFSRAILGWSIGSKNCAANIKNALQMAMQTIREYYPDHICATLVADGGSENHAVKIDELLTSTEHPEIKKVIALKDIAFSNSPIEAINKIVKRYLRHFNPSTDSQLETCITHVYQDYTFARPHGSLNGMIPIEAYAQTLPDMDFSDETRQARAERIAENRKNACGMC